MRATIATVITTGATTTSADCRPLPSVSAMGGRSSRLVANPGGGRISHGKGSPGTWAAPARARSPAQWPRARAGYRILPLQGWGVAESEPHCRAARGPRSRRAQAVAARPRWGATSSRDRGRRRAGRDANSLATVPCAAALALRRVRRVLDLEIVLIGERELTLPGRAPLGRHRAPARGVEAEGVAEGPAGGPRQGGDASPGTARADARAIVELTGAYACARYLTCRWDGGADRTQARGPCTLARST